MELINNGVTTFTGLTDVNVTPGSSIDGYGITWNNSTSKFVATQRMGATLANFAIPVIMVPTGTIDAAGVITLGTALATTYANAWIYLPAGAISGGSAGVYYATFSSTTVGSVKTNYVNTATTTFIPTIPTSPVAAVGAGAYTQTTGADVVLANVSVPAGAMGASGMLIDNAHISNNSTAGNKTLNTKFGGSATMTATVMTTNRQNSWLHTISNRANAALQVCSTSIPTNSANSAMTYLTIDTSVAQAFTYVGQLAVATDYIVLESVNLQLTY